MNIVIFVSRAQKIKRIISNRIRLMCLCCMFFIDLVGYRCSALLFLVGKFQLTNQTAVCLTYRVSIAVIAFSALPSCSGL